MTEKKKFPPSTRRRGFRSIHPILMALLFSALAATAYCGADAKLRLSGTALAEGPKKTITIGELEALTKQTSYSTYNPFVRKSESYSGVLLADFAAHYGSPAIARITLVAIDGYETTISKEEWGRWPILLTTRVEGKLLEVRDSGPAKIIFPYDDMDDADQRKYNRKWIWLISKIRLNVADGE